ncbi:MAG: DUF4012 domain-containing protein [Candidatus Shapirobacteria bacterium]|nr:DUF4012 domain-containing protein [Candidatus Shapirobacteria bacterium]
MDIINLNQSPPINPKIEPLKKSYKIFGKIKINKKIVSILSVILIIITVILTICFFVFFIPGKKIIKQIEIVKSEANFIQQAINDKDLEKVQQGLTNIKNDTKSIESNYKKMGLFKIIPGLRKYYQDGQRAINIVYESIDTGEIVLKAIDPYKDFLGIQGSASSSTQTTEDRITFLTESIEGLIPYLDSIETKITDIDNNLSQIDINRYPQSYKGVEIRSNISKAQDIVSQVKTLIKDDKPLLSKVSWLLGKDSPRKYLMIFQNDGELRPSGGFWTAYSTLTVNNGKVTPGVASNIYDLDDKINSRVPAPRLIKSYHINVPYLNLRDSNLSPDFPTDAQIFLEQYLKTTGGKGSFDGVIAIDTQLLVDMVKVLGKLDTRVGTFTADPDKRCDGCPSIIYDLQWMSGRPRDYIEPNRKDFMNPLMSALLTNVMGSEKSKMASLIQAFFKNINEKHIMTYFPDSEMQNIGNLANITGKIIDVDKNTDYFHLNDANFASAKSNIFITQKIKHNITIKNGVAQHKISVTYINPTAASNCNLEKGDLCLNASQYRDLFRFYVPIGSKLIKMTGSEIDPVQYEELNKQVFEGFYGDKYPLYPKSNLITSIEYTSGATIGSTYTLILQKQPGTKAVEYELTINGKKQPEFQWAADKTIKLSL